MSWGGKSDPLYDHVQAPWASSASAKNETISVALLFTILSFD
jgi:hypothetical protein